jgi:hypothetical protein
VSLWRRPALDAIIPNACWAQRRRAAPALAPHKSRRRAAAGSQGGLLLAIQSGIAVVPVAICGPRRVMGRALGWRPMAAAHCTVVLGRPVATAGLSYEDRDAFCAALQAEVRRRRRRTLRRPPRCLALALPPRTPPPPPGLIPGSIARVSIRYQCASRAQPPPPSHTPPARPARPQVARLKAEFEAGEAAAPGAVRAGAVQEVEPLWHCFVPAPPADRPAWGRARAAAAPAAAPAPAPAPAPAAE